MASASDFTIIVSGIPENTDPADVKKYFENKRKSKGGTVLDCAYDTDNCSFLISFQNEIDHKNVLEYQKHTFQKTKIQVQNFHLPEETQQMSPSRAEILVEQLSPNSDEGDVREYFSDYERSGGGQIKHILYMDEDDDDYFRVIFEDEKVARSVLAHKEHILHDVQLKVTSAVSEIEYINPGLKVTDLDGSTLDDHIRDYFSNEEIGGGPITSIEYDDDIDGYRIEFEDCNVVHQMLYSGKAHELHGAVLTLEAYEIEDKEDIVKFEGFPKGTPEQEAVTFITNARKSGGGPFEKYVYEAVPGICFVKYKSCDVTKRVLEKQTCKFKKTTLTAELITKFPDISSEPLIEQTSARIEAEVHRTRDLPLEHNDSSKEKEHISSKCLRINGWTESLGEEVVLAYFQNHSRSGGGKVIGHCYNYQEKQGHLLYQNEADCMRVVKQGNHSICGQPLDVAPHVEDFDLFTNDETEADDTCLQVTWDEGDVSQDIVEMFFSLKKRSGGGDILNTEFLPEERKALITYVDPADCISAHAMCNDGIAAIGGATFRSQRVRRSLAGQSSAVELSNVPDGINIDMLELHFESKRSKGDTIEHIHRDKEQGRIIITYQSVEVAERVAAEKTCVLQDVTIHIKPLRPKSPTTDTADHNRTASVLYRGLPSSFTSEEFKRYLEHGLASRVRKVIYSRQPGSAIVQFTIPIALELVTEQACLKPFRGSMLQVEKMPEPKSILVTHDGGKPLEQSYLELYFENTKKSHGGDIRQCEMRPDGSGAVIEFEDTEVLRGKIFTVKHTISGQTLTVVPYYKELGEMNTDPETPPSILPTQTEVPLENRLLTFLFSSAQNKNKVDDILQNMYGLVIWKEPCPRSGMITIKCSLSESSPAAAALSSQWERLIQEKWQVLMDQFYQEDLDIPHEIKDKFMSIMDRITSPFKDCIEVKFDSDLSILSAFGVKETVDRLKKDVLTLCDILEEEDRKRNERHDQYIELHHQYIVDLLESGDVLDDIKKRHCVDVVELDGKKIHIHGQTEAAGKAKDELRRLVSQAQYSAVKFETSIAQLIARPDVMQSTKAELKSKGVVVYLEKSSAANAITVRSFISEYVSQTESYLKQKFVQHVMPVDKQGETVLKSPQWKDFVDKLVNGSSEFINIVWNDTHTKVFIATTKAYIGSINITVNSFINSNKLIEFTCSFDNLQARLVQMHLGVDITNVLKTFEPTHSGPNLSQLSENGKLSTYIRCEVYDKASRGLTALFDKIETRDFIVDKVGMWNYFNRSQGKTFVKSLENDYRTVLQVGNSITGPVISPSPAKTRKTYPCEEIQVGPIILGIRQGDITSANLDAVVNVAGKARRGLLADSILKAAGSAVEREWLQKFQKGGMPCQGFISGGGGLNVRGIIHIIAPGYTSRDSKQSVDDLRKCLANCFSMMSSARYKSVALPAIGRGQGFTSSVIADVIIDGVIDLVGDEEVEITRIEIIDREERFIKEFKSALSKRESLSDGTRKRGPPKELTSSKRTLSPADVRETKSPSMLPSVIEKGGIKIEVLTGTIAAEKVDMIIAPAGVVVNSIISSGPAELKEKLRIKVKPGEVKIVETDGIGCKYIALCSCAVWSRGSSACRKKLNDVVETALRKAEELGCMTIACPAIGTGRIGVPKEVSAEILIGAAMKHGPDAISVKAIKFIIYEKDTAVLQAFKTYLSDPQPCAEAENASTGTSFSTKDSTALAAPSEHPQAEWDITANFNVTLKYGDITKERCDAIICSTDLKYPLKAGAARAISAAAGDLFVNNFYKAKTKSTDVVLIDGGQLPSKHVLVLAAMKDRPNWERTITHSLQKLESMSRMRRVCCVALGTGGGSLSNDTMASIMLDAFRTFANSPDGKTFISSVVIVIPRDKQDIMTTFKDKLTLKKKENLNFLARTYETISEYAGGLLGDMYSGNVANPENVPGFKASETVAVKSGQKPLPSNCIRFCSITKAVSDAVSKRIEQQTNSEFVMKQLDKEDDKAAIKILQDDHKNDIQGFGKKHDVKVIIGDTISIEGQKENVTNCVADIRTVFLTAERSDRARAEFSYKAKEVVWYYQTDGEFKKYENDFIGLIEEALTSKKPYAEWLEEGGVTVRVYFDRMKEEVVGDPSSATKVAREVVDPEIPKSWSPMPKEDLRLVELSPEGDEYKDFITHMSATSGGFVPKNAKIERIQNRTLYKQYRAVKIAQESAAPAGTLIERRLWHGTAPDAVDNINSKGFDRGYHGKNGTAYGKGAYFARDFSYSNSAGYSKPDPAGKRRIYLCTVLTGEFTVARSDMTVAPMKPGSTTTYDSVVNNTTDPSIFVIFRDTNAYPAYIMTHDA